MLLFLCRTPCDCPKDCANYYCAESSRVNNGEGQVFWPVQWCACKDGLLGSTRITFPDGSIQQLIR